MSDVTIDIFIRTFLIVKTIYVLKTYIKDQESN